MSTRQHWGLHGYTVNSYKKQLEEALTRLQADAPSRGQIEWIVGLCDEHLNSKELRDGRAGDLVEDWEPEEVKKWIVGLVKDHPELSDWIRV